MRERLGTLHEARRCSAIGKDEISGDIASVIGKLDH